MNIFKKFFSSINPNSKNLKSSGPNTLKISPSLKEFVSDELLPGLNISEDYFWKTFENILDMFTKRNIELLEERGEIQRQIDNWHIQNKDNNFDISEYKAFLEDIGYIHPRSSNFSIKTWNVDPEIRKIAGPQLVVPVMNARFALNATNARWGSLYDALYGTDVISESDGAKREGGYNPIRGEKVIAFAKDFLDTAVPLQSGKYDEVLDFEFVESELLVTLSNGKKVIEQLDRAEAHPYGSRPFKRKDYIQKFLTLTNNVLDKKESSRFLKTVQNLKKLKSGELDKLNIQVKKSKIKKNFKKGIF